MTKIQDPRSTIQNLIVCVCVSTEPFMRNWPVRLLRRWLLFIANVWTRSRPTFATALTILVSHPHVWQCHRYALKNNCRARQKKKGTRFKLTRHNNLSLPGDQNAINDLMQMRLTGGGGGMMAEKLEVNPSEPKEETCQYR